MQGRYGLRACRRGRRADHLRGEQSRHIQASQKPCQVHLFVQCDIDCVQPSGTELLPHLPQCIGCANPPRNGMSTCEHSLVWALVHCGFHVSSAQPPPVLLYAYGFCTSAGVAAGCAQAARHNGRQQPQPSELEEVPGALRAPHIILFVCDAHSLKRKQHSPEQTSLLLQGLSVRFCTRLHMPRFFRSRHSEAPVQ